MKLYIHNLISKVTGMQKDNEIINSKLAVINEELSEKSEVINKQATEIDMLNKRFVNKFTFCEQIQRNNLAKNLVISGIATNI